jgi:hypothetical protein
MRGKSPVIMGAVPTIRGWRGEHGWPRLIRSQAAWADLGDDPNVDDVYRRRLVVLSTLRIWARLRKAVSRTITVWLRCASETSSARRRVLPDAPEPRSADRSWLGP